MNKWNSSLTSTVVMLHLLIACGGSNETKSLRSASAVSAPGSGSSDSGPAGIDSEGAPTKGAEDSGLSASGELQLTSRVARLSTREIDNSLELILRDTNRPAARLLPQESREPFDTRAADQIARFSSNTVLAFEALAQDVADRFVADSARREAVLNCKDLAASACLAQFVQNVGRQFFRRSLAPEEQQQIVQAATAAASPFDLNASVAWSVAFFVQHPEFIYRVEHGTDAQANARTLAPREWLTRVSLYLTGAVPEQAWIEKIEKQGLADAAARRTMLEDIWHSPRVMKHLADLHAMWLGYERKLADSDRSRAMIVESSHLIEQVVGGNKPWTELFTAPQTFVSKDLAAHYGLAAPAGAEGWVPYDPTSGRAGILSHGSFLAMGTKSNGVTSTHGAR